MKYRSGVDVDRFDYMIRDCLNVPFSHKSYLQLGLNCSYNYDRIIKGARVIKNKLNELEVQMILSIDYRFVLMKK